MAWDRVAADEWFREHVADLEAYAGQWIAINALGLAATADSLEGLRQKAGDECIVVKLPAANASTKKVRGSSLRWRRRTA
jgi:hypothetical protein